MKHLLVVFVCTGNICRSPLAEGILKDKLLDEAKNNKHSIPIQVTSAGTHAPDWNPASQNAVYVAADHGIILNFHRSNLITGKLVAKADLILTMERGHAEFIKSLWPDVDSVYELKLFGLEKFPVHFSTDIPDPVGMNVDFFREVYGELEKEICRIMPILLSMAHKKNRD